MGGSALGLGSIGVLYTAQYFTYHTLRQDGGLEIRASLHRG